MKLFLIGLLSVFLFIGVWSVSNSTPNENVIIDAENQINEVNNYKIIWHWEDEFSDSEMLKIKKWLSEIYFSTQEVLGQYPFDLHLFIHKSENKNEPVPWANTTRGNAQGVHFHVNPDFELHDFVNDWTAQHEISHLSIPFVGKSNSWFSEGYATFMQYQVMINQDVYSMDEVETKYLDRLVKCKPMYASNSSFIVVSDSLKKSWHYADMYWGGVSFFWKLNKEYTMTKKGSLVEIVKAYESCCRINRSTPKDFCSVLDSISHSSSASDLLFEYQNNSAKSLFDEFN